MFELLKTDSQTRARPGMKFKLILCLALVLSSGFLGCSTISPATKTEVLDYANDNSPDTEEVEVTDLGNCFSIRLAADSWPALVRKTKPRFAWSGCDLMWIETNQQGELQFTLDEAYVYQPTNQPLQWVLLDEKTNVPYKDGNRVDPRNFDSCLNLRAVAPLRDDIPRVQNDGGERGNYAVTTGTNPRHGSVYQIGWQREMGASPAHPEYERRIYLFQDRLNDWHFLGEGPEQGEERGAENAVQSQVEWIEAAKHEPPLKIKFHVETRISPREWDYSADDTNYPPDEYKTNNYVLAGPFPAKFQELK
ncbi:MAG TPA: hypothetical protein VK742_21505 [Candidatus Sulfotelmatobacter sp.]|nr:hypothetical protein [Candidatus Sulfotelmatobacter sp.]